MHEQNKKLIKSDRGVVGIQDSAKVLLKWMISGPVIASVIIKVNLNITNTKSHHENNQPFEELHLIHPTVFEEFQKGFSTVNKSN